MWQKSVQTEHRKREKVEKPFTMSGPISLNQWLLCWSSIWTALFAREITVNKRTVWTKFSREREREKLHPKWRASLPSTNARANSERFRTEHFQLNTPIFQTEAQRQIHDLREYRYSWNDFSEIVCYLFSIDDLHNSRVWLNGCSCWVYRVCCVESVT